MKISERNNRTADLIWELLAVAFLATGGIFVRISSLPPISTGFYRVLFSLPLLFPLARRGLKQLSRKDTVLLLFAGVFLAGDIALWNLSFSYTTVANANLLTNLTPFTVIPVSYFLFKEQIPKLFYPGAALAIAGVFMVIGGKADPDPSNYLGDLLALSASVFYAAFLLISYRLRERMASSVIMFVSGFGSAAALLITAVLTEGVQIPGSTAEIWPLLGLTLCLQVIGHNLLAWCQGKINVNLSSVVCLLQPVFASVYSLLFFSERLAVGEVLGIVIVIAGVFLVKLQYKKPLTPPPNPVTMLKKPDNRQRTE